MFNKKLRYLLPVLTILSSSNLAISSESCPTYVKYDSKLEKALDQNLENTIKLFEEGNYKEQEKQLELRLNLIGRKAFSVERLLGCQVLSGDINWIQAEVRNSLSFKLSFDNIISTYQTLSLITKNLGEEEKSKRYFEKAQLYSKFIQSNQNF